MAQTITDLKIGKVINLEGEPYVITWNSFMRTAQRKPVMRTKLRNIISGRVLEKTFSAGEAFDLADIEKAQSQYLYKDQENAYFMDSITFDQFSIRLDLAENQIMFLKEGQNTIVTKFENRPIGIELPPKVVLKVIEALPGVKGDTAQGGTKPATLETGIVVQVPLFINPGDNIRVNTETHEYADRV